jgi:hypothetical protein
MTGDAQIGDLMAELAAGRMPPTDARVLVVPAPSTTHAAVLAFTAHHLIAADVPGRWIQAQVRHDPFTAPTSPAFLLELGRRAGHPAGTMDVVFTAPAGSASSAHLTVHEVPPDSQPRVERARRYRRDVRVWQTLDEAGLIVIGRGLGGRWEASYEVALTHRGRGLGRQLATTARTLIPPTDTLFLQASPGNAASIRAAIGAGYTVIGAEVLFGGRVGSDPA